MLQMVAKAVKSGSQGQLQIPIPPNRARPSERVHRDVELMDPTTVTGEDATVSNAVSCVLQLGNMWGT